MIRLSFKIECITVFLCFFATRVRFVPLLNVENEIVIFAGFRGIILPYRFRRLKTLILRCFLGLYFLHARPPFAYIICLLLSYYNFSAYGAILEFVVCRFIRLSAILTNSCVFRFCKLNIQILICRKYGDSKPFTDNMRISYTLNAHARIAVVKPYAISVIIITAQPFYKGVYLSALFRSKVYSVFHSSGGLCEGGFLPSRSPCSFFA